MARDGRPRGHPCAAPLGCRAMEGINEYLRRLFEVASLAEQSLAARRSVPEALQGPPAIAHGGAVAALLLELAERHTRETGIAAALPRPLRAEVALVRAI